MLNSSDTTCLLRIMARYAAIFEPYRFDRSGSAGGASGAVGERRIACTSGAGMAWKIGGDGRNRQAGYVSLGR